MCDLDVHVGGGPVPFLDEVYKLRHGRVEVYVAGGEDGLSLGSCGGGAWFGDVEGHGHEKVREMGVDGGRDSSLLERCAWCGGGCCTIR